MTRRNLPLPLPKMYFRVFLGGEEVGVESITPLHWVDAEGRDPELRQTVTLRRAVGTSRAFYLWRKAAAAGRGRIRQVTIAQLHEPGGEPVNIWQLQRARPIRWTGPDFDAMAEAFAYEELEIAYESIAWLGKA